MVVSTIVEASLEYYKDLEKSLRPTSHVGWNSAIGGLSGTPHTEESKLKMSMIQKEVQNRPSLIEARAGRDYSKTLFSEESKQKRKLTVQGRDSYEASQADKEFWARADEFYEYYIQDTSRCKTDFANNFGIVKSKFLVLLKKFKLENWNPLADTKWQQWKQKTAKHLINKNIRNNINEHS